MPRVADMGIGSRVFYQSREAIFRACCYIGKWRRPAVQAPAVRRPVVNMTRIVLMHMQSRPFSGRGAIVSISGVFKRLVSGDHAGAGSAASVRNVIVWMFIALVALFLTQPAGGPFSAPGMQVPWPAELELDEGVVGTGA
jgi:hypothetical protein